MQLQKDYFLRNFHICFYIIPVEIRREKPERGGQDKYGEYSSDDRIESERAYGNPDEYCGGEKILRQLYEREDEAVFDKRPEGKLIFHHHRKNIEIHYQHQNVDKNKGKEKISHLLRDRVIRVRHIKGISAQQVKRENAGPLEKILF